MPRRRRIHEYDQYFLVFLVGVGYLLPRPQY